MNHGKSSESGGKYLIRPNQSINGREAALLVAGIAGFSLLVALGLALYFGAWPILPFAGLEIGLLVYAVWHVQRKAKSYELLELDDDEVRISVYSPGGGDCVTFQRYWCRVELVEFSQRNFPNQLLIGSHGKRIRIGECLTNDERLELAEQLGTCLRLMRVAG